MEHQSSQSFVSSFSFSSSSSSLPLFRTVRSEAAGPSHCQSGKDGTFQQVCTYDQAQQAPGQSRMSACLCLCCQQSPGLSHSRDSQSTGHHPCPVSPRVEPSPVTPKIRATTSHRLSQGMAHPIIFCRVQDTLSSLSGYRQLPYISPIVGATISCLPRYGPPTSLPGYWPAPHLPQCTGHPIVIQ